ncbi:uncharacterized protein BXZ73DRAFT_82345 [Epithele typhae]|uniref:uncharacterized protein n=1 Tax=Epithele typhae TaxID=378194 RepID=UPI002008057F|nr:uncharacterized protein BXZ73DRAFT_82345 [Epithele typhae]KAH9912331.1 hypothetical protein BXZ73DRAFT_82345 [Epithele typhae]
MASESRNALDMKEARCTLPPVFEPVLNSQGSEELKAQYKEVVARGGSMARLILLSGVDAGPHLSLVQLRSLDDHAVLPGITVGDISTLSGMKGLGVYDAVDNGCARLDHVRIPRKQMLSVFASMTIEAEYVKPSHAKLSYGGMLYTHSAMVASAGWTIAKGIAIALRYATSAFASYLLWRMHACPFGWERASKHVVAGEMHATLGGLKAICMRTTFLLPLSEFDYRYEGDNFVLDQQVVLAALKAFDAAPLLSPSWSTARRSWFKNEQHGPPDLD